MNLFQKVNFISHSRKPLDWKLQCDALTNEDWECIAYLISKRFEFDYVVGIPEGGMKLAKALEKYKTKTYPNTTLIVDDVLTTGTSMENKKKKFFKNDLCLGVVLFARGECPEWITPIFQMMEGC